MKISTVKRNCPNHWFESGTMNFWGTEILTDVITYKKRKEKINIFITRDNNFDRTKKLVSIREVQKDFSINTIEPFQGFKSKKEALRYLEDDGWKRI